jgi:hypothetical protein
MSVTVTYAGDDRASGCVNVGCVRKVNHRPCRATDCDYSITFYRYRVARLHPSVLVS